MLRLMSHICLKTKRCEAGSSGSFWLVPTSFETCSVGYWNISLVNVVVVWGENIGVYCRVITLFTLSCVSGCWWRNISNIYSCDFDAAEAMFTFNSLTSGISSTAVVWWLYCMIFFFEFDVQDMNSCGNLIPLTHWIILCNSKLTYRVGEGRY